MSNTNFQVGDCVQLTGDKWGKHLYNKYVWITSVLNAGDGMDARFIFNGMTYRVDTSGGTGFSATLFEKKQSLQAL